MYLLLQIFTLFFLSFLLSSKSSNLFRTKVKSKKMGKNLLRNFSHFFYLFFFLTFHFFFLFRVHTREQIKSKIDNKERERLVRGKASELLALELIETNWPPTTMQKNWKWTFFLFFSFGVLFRNEMKIPLCCARWTGAL